MIHFITGRAGSGKTEYLYNVIKRLHENGNRDMILLVPEQASFETEKDILGVLGDYGQYSVETLSFKRFCDRLYSVYKYEKEQCISDTGRCVLMSSALRRCKKQLELFSNHAEDFSFAQTLLSLYEQMKKFGLSSEKLFGAADRSEHILGEKLRDIGTVFAQYESFLCGEYYDPSDRLTRATAALDSHPYFVGKTVFVDSFKGFTEQQMGLLEKIISQADDVYFAFCCDRNRNDALSPFGNVLSLISRIKRIACTYSKQIASPVDLSASFRLRTPELKFLESAVYSGENVKYDGNCENIVLSGARDIYAETDFVAAEIHRLVREEKYRFRDFAVVARNIDEYFPAIESAFERRGVTYYADRRRPAVSKAVFRFARYALKAARTLSTDEIIGLLKTGLSGLNDLQISELENYTDIWQIKRGWTTQWKGSPAGALLPDSESERRLELINEQRKQIIMPLSDFAEKLSSAQTAGEKCEALFDFAERMRIGENLYSMTKQMEQNGCIDLAADERQCYDLFISVLDQIYMSVGSEIMGLSEFESLFDTAVSACDTGEIPQGLDEVIVGAADRIRPKSPKVTFILGANYGVFPQNPSRNPIFTKTELDVLENIGCALSTDGVSEQTDERFLVYTLLCSASEKLYVSYSECDLSGQPLECSEVADMLKKLFDGCRYSARSGLDAVENECDLKKLLSVTDSANDAAAAAAVEYYKQKGEVIKACGQLDPSSFKLSEETAKKCFGERIVLSSSKIDVYYQCRFRYLCQYVLKIRPLKKTEIDVMERGTIVHYVLEKLVLKYSDAPALLLNLSDGALESEVEALVDESTAGYMLGRDFTQVEQYSRRKLIKSLCALAIRIFSELCSTDFKVMMTELAIGNVGDKKETVPALELDIGDGRKVLVTGIIDRADIYRNEKGEYIRIIDYKTGSKSLKLSDVICGCNIQMLLYMSALIRYMRQSGSDAFPAGVYYMPARLDYVSADKNGTDDVDSQLNDKLRYSGITACDDEIIKAMDKTEDRNFSPVKIKRGVPDPEAMFTERQFELLCDKIDSLVADMGRGLFTNDFRAEPICPDMGKKTVCDYCDYRSVCGRQPDEGVSILAREKNSEVLKMLEKGDER